MRETTHTHTPLNVEKKANHSLLLLDKKRTHYLCFLLWSLCGLFHGFVQCGICPSSCIRHLQPQPWVHRTVALEHSLCLLTIFRHIDLLRIHKPETHI